MEFDEVIESRRSCRGYHSYPVSNDTLIRLIESARISPSSSNQQPWHFIIVRNKDVMQKIAGKFKWAAEATAMIVGLADFNTSPDWCINDHAIAFEHIILTATNIGLGTCWLGLYRPTNELEELLGVPSGYKVMAATPIGFASDEPKGRNRKNLDDILSWEKFGGEK